jgi:hypothetical protein
LVRDVTQSAKELLRELHITLGYPMLSLVTLLKRMSKYSSLWTAVCPQVVSIMLELKNEEDAAAAAGLRWEVMED